MSTHAPEDTEDWSIHDLHFSCRPNLDEPAAEVLLRWWQGLAGFNRPWNVIDRFDIPELDFAGGVSANLQYILKVHPRVSIAFSFALRSKNYLTDEGRTDDKIRVEFTDGADYRECLSESLVALIELFRPYRVDAHLNALLLSQDGDAKYALWEKTRKESDGRAGIFRIRPVNFWDRELCKRAFRRSPEDIERCLKPIAARTSLLAGGVLVILSEDDLSYEQLVELDWKARERLR